MAKVSVVVPYWKGPKYLEDCVSAIQGQEVSCEVLLVCDRGHDEVPASVRGADYIKIISAERSTGEDPDPSKPLGVAYCRNLALDKASSEYVYFMDSDDYLLEDSLASMLALAEEKQALVVTGNQYSSWFSFCNFDPEKAGRETEITQTGLLSGEILRQRFRYRITVQHMLIRRTLLEENHIRFDEGQIHYSDIPFVLQVLRCAAGRAWVSGDSFYVFRRHNDRVHLPSLSQTEDQDSTGEYLDAYRNAREDMSGEDQELATLLDHALVQFILSHYPHYTTESVLPVLRSAFQQMKNWRALTEDAVFWQRRMLGAIRSGHNRLAGIYHKCYVIRKKKRGLLGNRIQWYRVAERLIFRRMPLRKDWILFESFFGRSYSDSPKYLYEYLQKTYGSRYRYIWVMNKSSHELAKTGKHTVCRLESLRYVYFMARCGYRIFNVRQPSWSKKREGIVFVETWHGTPLKKLGFDMGDVFSSNPEFKSVFYRQAKEWDYLISANPFSTDVFTRAFGCRREQILEYGYPRNDILYAQDGEGIAADVKRELGIPEGRRVILYAPTWRDDQVISVGHYGFELALDLALLQREVGQDSVILLRTHYYVAQQMDFSAYQGFVYDGSQYEDVSRLYLISDILITDYSSVFFDYANLKRPILFFAYDYESYAEEMRGLYIDMERELPGPVLTTNQEVVEALRRIDEVSVQYRTRYEEFYERFCCVDDGRASERIIEEVFHS